MHTLLELQQWVDLPLWIHMSFSAKAIQLTEEMRQSLLLLLELEPTVCNEQDRAVMQKRADPPHRWDFRVMKSPFPQICAGLCH